MVFNDYLTVSTKSLNRISARVWQVCIGGLLLTAGGLMEGNAFAQAILPNPNNVLANPAPTQPLSTEWQQEQPNEMNVFQEAGAAAENPVPQIFRFGPVTLRPHGDYNVMYAHGILFDTNDPENTIIQSISPGLRFDIGRQWALDYTPTFQYYSNAKFRNVVNHAISLSGDAEYEAWVFGFSHGTTLTDDPTAATGSQTEQNLHITTLTATRALNEKFSTTLELNQNITLISGSEDSYQWSTMDWLNYLVWPRCTVGIGIGGGYDMINADNSFSGNENLDQSFENLEAQGSWRITDKISVQANVGFKYTQFNTAGTSDSLEPIFGAGIQYLPFKHTQLSLDASRTVASSDYYIVSQQTEMTVVNASLTQQLFKKFSLGLSIGYAITDYNTAISISSFSASANRTDDDVMFSARLSHPLFKRGTWAIFYQYSDNTSTEKAYSFTSNQVGLDISYSF